jgi:hypothetical protein
LGKGAGRKARTGEKLRGFDRSNKATATGAAACTVSCNLSREDSSAHRANANAAHGGRRLCCDERFRNVTLPVSREARGPGASLVAVNIVETILVFALIPAAIYGVVALLTLRSKFAGSPRYRPGQAWEYPPMWWSGNPAGVGAPHRHASSGEASETAAGGARGSW